MASRLNIYLKDNQFFPKFQSAYSSLHSTETALLKVHNDVVHLLGQRKTVMLVLLDLSDAR